MNIALNQTSLQPVKNIKIPDVFYRRVKTNIEKFDEFLSGGWLPGTVFTFTARAGLGKSRLMLQTLESIAKQNLKVAYISCEESIYQIAYNCATMNIKEVPIANLQDVDEICNLMEGHAIVIIDSFPGLTTKHNLNKTDHEKYCLEKILNTAKKTECVVGIIFHQTKTGNLKGSSLILHEVDATMALNLPDEMENEHQRVLSFDKNRFGATKEMPCEMHTSGYIFEDVVESAHKTPPPKTTKRMQMQSDILALDGQITLKRVLPFVNGDVHRAMQVLREMVLNDLLIKNGRGNNAFYQKI
jgi:DNA repair protein RadA/Sms